MVGVIVVFLLLCAIVMLTVVATGIGRSTRNAIAKTRDGAHPPSSRSQREAELAEKEAQAGRVLEAARIFITTENANGSNFQVPKDSSDHPGELQFETGTLSWHSVSDRLRKNRLCAIVTSREEQPDPYDEVRVTVYHVITPCLSIRVTRGGFSTTLLLTAHLDGHAEFYFAEKEASQVYPADRYGWHSLLPELKRLTSPAIDRASRPVLPDQPPPPKMPMPEVGGPLHSARALERSGDLEAARKMYEDIMQNGSITEQPGATFSLAFMEATEGNPEKAVALYELVVESDDAGYSRAASNNLRFLGRSD